MEKEIFLTIHSDGGSRGNPGPAAYAFIVNAGGEIIHQDSEYLGRATNNVAEYMGVLKALTWVFVNYKSSYEKIDFLLDSELVVKQLNGNYKIKNEVLKKIYLQIKLLEKDLSVKIFFKNIPRNLNKLADYLVNKTLDESS